MHYDPTLKIDGIEIPVINQFKFLGVIFDKKLTLIPHFHYLKNKCCKALNLLCIIAHTTWSTDQQTLLKFYKTLIQSKIDSGCFINWSVRTSYQKPLNTNHHEALRLTLGAFRTSSVESQYTLAHEPPLHHRFQKLGLQ